MHSLSVGSYEARARALARIAAVTRGSNQACKQGGTECCPSTLVSWQHRFEQLNGDEPQREGLVAVPAGNLENLQKIRVAGGGKHHGFILGT